MTSHSSALISAAPPQAPQWIHHTLQQEESEVPERWLLLEKEERREDDKRGSHEAKSAGHGGERPLDVWMRNDSLSVWCMISEPWKKTKYRSYKV